jgi:predicted O-methyltransferase YrrM
MPITEYLISRGFNVFEGYCQEQPLEVQDLIALTTRPYLRMMEIGFNAGHSAEVFLQNNPTLTLTSFDLGEHAYVSTAKEYIDMTYPNRHSLILGNSTETVPQYHKDHPEATFDVIFIDGAHDYETANKDVDNCMALANKNTLVILDDTMYTQDWVRYWTVGPTQTWTEHIANNTILPLHHVDYRIGNGLSWGLYNV